jgi:membrane-bound serine protease (ClpP class)
MKEQPGVGLRRLAGAALVLAGVLACTGEPAAIAGDVVVYRIPVDGVIELGLAPFIERSLGEAEQTNAAAVVLEIRTDGGRVDAAQRITHAVEDTEIPVYAYVNRKAYSAGAMIALSADEVFMRDGGRMGAATPVTGQGQKAPEKIVSAMRSEMRALAERRGLDPAVAEAMVDESVAVDGVVEAGKLLTLTTEEAEAIGYARSVVDLDDVFRQVGLSPDRIVDAQVNWAEGVVRFITHPVVAPFLLSLGFLGLLVEIKTPTFGLAGTAGGVALALFFGGHYLVGLAGMEEIILLLAGVVLLAVEAFIVPGFGVFGILGIGGILGGVYLSLVGSLSTLADYSQAAMILSASVLIVLVSAWALIRTLPSNTRLRKMGILLGEETSRDRGYISAPVRAELVGMHGVAVTDLRPAGVGRFGAERVDIVAEEGWLEAGTAIEIVRAEGYRHLVRATEGGEASDTTEAGEASDATEAKDDADA